MSRNLRIILLVGLLVLAGAAGWYFFLGPGSDPEESFETTTPPPSQVTGTGTDCPPGGSAGAGTATPPAATPPADGTTTPPPAGDGTLTPPPADGTLTPPPAATPPPAEGAPVVRGGHGEGTVVAAAAGDWDPSASSDSRIVAQTTDPAATAGTTPPAGVTPPAGTPPAATPPVGTPPAGDATGGATPGMPQAQDPCDNAATGTPPADGGAADPAGEGAAGEGGGGATISASDGTNAGNNPEALATSKAVVAIGAKNKLTVAVDTTLVPVTGGVATGSAKLRVYRGNVTGAALRITFADATSQGEWDRGTREVRQRFVNGFLTFLRRRYPKASRSVTVVASDGRVLAVGDAPGAGKGTVQIVG